MFNQIQAESNNHHNHSLNINATKHFINFSPVEHCWREITLLSKFPVIVSYGKNSEFEHYFSKLYDKYDLSVVFMNNSDEDTDGENKVIYFNIYLNGKVIFIGNSADPDCKNKINSFLNKDY